MTENKTIRVATDVGGTFTDLVYFETDTESGAQTVRTAKVDTTPPDFEAGVFNVLEKGGVDVAKIDFLAHGTTGRSNEIVTAEGRPDLVREARVHWGVENNIYQFGHRGFTAVAGGAGDCPYSYMTDLAAGRYRLPWEDDVRITDGTSCGFDRPILIPAQSLLQQVRK